MFVNGSGWNEQSLSRTFHRCFLPSLVQLAKRFRRRFLKLANQKQELPVAAMFDNRSGQNEQSLERTFHRYFLPSFSSFSWEVSEEKIKMWKVNGRRMTDAKWWQKLTLPLARWAKKPGVPGEKHRLVASHWQTLTHNVVSSTSRHERASNSQLSGDWHWLPR